MISRSGQAVTTKARLHILINAPRIEQHGFEKGAKFFESCLPIEVLASRGVDTLRFGPMKPVGLIDKRTEEKNYAVVQLRQDNSAKTLFNLVGFQTNLKWGAQKELLQSHKYIYKFTNSS